jgi:hypothetical protein
MASSGVGAPGHKHKDLLSSLQAIAAPGATFNKLGVTKNAYMQVGDVGTNKTGFPIRLTGAELIFISVTNDNNTASFEVEIYEFDGTTETLLDTVSVVSARGADYVPTVPIPITYGSELRAKVNNSGTATSPVCIAFTTGEVPS